MKNKKIKDERILLLNNKIHSEAYIVVLFLLTASVFIKFYIMDMPFSQYVFELTSIILSIIYIAIRSVLVGYNFMDTSKGGKALTISVVLVLSLIVSIVNGIRNYSMYNNKYDGIFDGHFIAVLVFTFVSAIIFISVMFVPLYWLNVKGQQRIEKMLIEEEE